MSNMQNFNNTTTSNMNPTSYNAPFDATHNKPTGHARKDSAATATVDNGNNKPATAVDDQHTYQFSTVRVHHGQGGQEDYGKMVENARSMNKATQEEKGTTQFSFFRVHHGEDAGQNSVGNAQTSSRR